MDDLKNVDKQPKWYKGMLAKKTTKKKDCRQKEQTTVVSESKREWIHQAPKLRKINPAQET